ncbi:uncharacterized protein FOMMEDRAFT_171202 [Fomitiporia mediterranea MF3/22]|uniref:uncharacterized protein n=1 Tax=Fomitiporia mediterranea (strain MF3/22) TaxID=694068 RepID=UPI0004409298|nr:uncharacterized protein FOMMEDRAFT_171202 [Fomitiporia mediterranea MF3/22]EJC98280.1 hypothetical protein FOMMEDRAFT_171202 [Fomitiporia mediterranea MF3/22]
MRKDVCSPCRERKVKCELLSDTGPCRTCIDRGISCAGPVPTQVKKKRLQEFTSTFDVPFNEPASFVVGGQMQEAFPSTSWPLPPILFIPKPWAEAPSAPVVLDYYTNQASHAWSRGPDQGLASSLLPMIDASSSKQADQQSFPEWGLISDNPTITPLLCSRCGAPFGSSS